jgi:hypothetical protein
MEDSMRNRLCLYLFALLLAVPAVGAQDTSDSNTVDCNFDENRQLAVEYQKTAPSKKPVLGRDVPYDRVWAPGGKPMTLFVSTPVSLEGHSLPLGAYTMFVVPSEKKWKLIISKSTDTSGKYDEKDDILRATMDMGELPHPENHFSVFFGHVAPNQCALRFELDKVGAFATFEAKK